VVVLSLAGGVFGFWLAGMIQLGFWVAHSIELDQALMTPDPTLAVETQLRLMPARPIEPEMGVSALETKAAPDPNVVSLEPVVITGLMRSRATPPLRVLAPAPAARLKVAPSLAPLALPLPLPIAPVEPIEPIEPIEPTAPIAPDAEPGPQFTPES